MNADILLITVNKHEDRELRLCLESKKYKSNDHQGQTTLEIYSDYGSINGQRVFLAKSEIGSFTDGASYKTTKNAISDLNPKLIICVGIAWGSDEIKQKIGDVLLSSDVQLGSNTRVGENETKFRASRPKTSTKVKKIIKKCAESLQIKFHEGTIISKEDLYDNKQLRDQALAGVPSAIGGEMEGSGVYQAIEDARENGFVCDWIIVKAICDWGYKKNLNDKKKEKDQKLAAKNAAELITNSITQYKIVLDSAQKTHPITKVTKKTSAIFKEVNDGKLISLLNCHAALDFDVLDTNDVQSVKSDTIVYWPVRLRRPNIVHAAQTYVAAFLMRQGFRVRLCLDDLGSPAGYHNKNQGLQDFLKKINQWATVVADSEIAKDICNNHLLFSKYLEKNDKTVPEINVLAKLGDNLVEWLLAADKLRVILQHTKLFNEGDELETLLAKKPRKLLSPAVVWTILDVVIDHSKDRTQCVTLGGYDEFPIWRACPQREDLDIVSIFLPKVKGNMDTESLRPLAKHELENSLSIIPSIKEWVIPYLILFPAICAEQKDMVNRDWKSATNKELAQAVFKFYSNGN